VDRAIRGVGWSCQNIHISNVLCASRDLGGNVDITNVIVPGCNRGNVHISNVLRARRQFRIKSSYVDLAVVTESTIDGVAIDGVGSDADDVARTVREDDNLVDLSTNVDRLYNLPRTIWGDLDVISHDNLLSEKKQKQQG
jgi:hypothetical protein